MGKKGSAPQAPDPTETAGAQTGMNIGTAIANKWMGNSNQITPYGSQTWSQTGMQKYTDPLTGKSWDIPQFTSKSTMSPAQQKLYQQQTRAGTQTAKLAADQASKLGGILGKPMDLSGAPQVGAPQLGQVGTGPQMGTMGQGPQLQRGLGAAGQIDHSISGSGGYLGARQKVEDSLMARINPQLEHDRSAKIAGLANQGIKVGSEAYDREMNNLGQNANDARYGAILGAGQEQSRLAGLDLQAGQFQNAAQGQQFGQNLARGQFGNAAMQSMFGNDMSRTGFNNDARQQMFQNRNTGIGFNNNVAQQQFGNQRGMRSDYLNEQYAGRNQPINEIAALLGTGQVTQPNFQPAQGGGIANTDYAGIQANNYQQKMQAWQAQQQQGGGFMGGLFGLGGQLGAAAISDRRLKTDIRSLGFWRDMPIYAFRYIWGGPMQIGVMAQDMLTLRPEAVVPMGDFLAVDYARL